MKILKTVLMWFIALIHIVPFYLLISIALKSPQDTSSKWSLPKYLYLDNFSNSWANANLGNALVNNIVITAVAVIVVLVIGSMAAYPLARFPSKWNNFVYMACVSCLIVPALTILVPLYKFITDIGGMNTRWAIILLHVTFQLPISIFLFTGFIRQIPKELDEAALLDGCSRVGIFFRMILPLLKPITTTVTILVGVWIWNDYQFSVFFLQQPDVQTFPVALSQFISQYQNNIGWVASGCLISMLPLSILYLSLQRHFVKGMADGAVKG